MGNTGRWGSNSGMRPSATSIGLKQSLLPTLQIKEKNVEYRGWRRLKSGQNGQDIKQIYLRDCSFIFSL